MEERLQDIKNIEVLIPDRLYVSKNTDGGGISLRFLEWSSGADHVYVEEIMLVIGVGEPLREMRHTYFPNDGYVFYLDRLNYETAFEYCSKYFDMD